MWLDFLAIRVNSEKAADMDFTINVNMPDRDEQIVVEMSNATLTHIVGYTEDDATLSVEINRSDLERVMTGEVRLLDLIKDGTAKSTGDTSVLDQLASVLDLFDLGFELMPGTGAQDLTKAANPFAQPAPANTNGG
ncbi:hypothetical protein A9Q94_11880 [Rhodobacterales bacterium 56_14_T64]|nr:hypothetical protein A9Q94_11880 [Rhodobacterales bacterium 56_14_T64]